LHFDLSEAVWRLGLRPLTLGEVEDHCVEGTSFYVLEANITGIITARNWRHLGVDEDIIVISKENLVVDVLKKLNGMILLRVVYTLHILFYMSLSVQYFKSWGSDKPVGLEI